MTEIQKEILEHWNAFIYERDEDETDLVKSALSLLGDKPLKILEPACGGAKLAAPLAEAGHDVTGFDINDAMLHFARARAETLPNLHIHKADMLTTPWGHGFDAVILGSNIMLNIITDWDYQQAQKRLIGRACEALKTGGRLLLDFDCPDSLSSFAGERDWLCFDGTDDRGVFGQYFVLKGVCDEHARKFTSGGRYVIKTPGGEMFTHETRRRKYFPTLEQTCGWLHRAGFAIESLHGGHNGEPFDCAHRRAVILARKI